MGGAVTADGRAAARGRRAGLRPRRRTRRAGACSTSTSPTGPAATPAIGGRHRGRRRGAAGRLRRRRRVLRGVGRHRHRRPADARAGRPTAGRSRSRCRPDRDGACGFRAFPGGRRGAVGRRPVHRHRPRRRPRSRRINVHQRPGPGRRGLPGRPLGGDRRRRRARSSAGTSTRRPAAGTGRSCSWATRGDVVGVEVDAAGRHLATVSLDHTAIIWDMRAGRRPADAAGRPTPGPGCDAACAIVGRDLTPAEWRRYPARPAVAADLQRPPLTRPRPPAG